MLYFLNGIRVDMASTLPGHVTLDIGCCGGLRLRVCADLKTLEFARRNFN